MFGRVEADPCQGAPVPASWEPDRGGRGFGGVDLHAFIRARGGSAVAPAWVGRLCHYGARVVEHDSCVLGVRPGEQPAREAVCLMLPGCGSYRCHPARRCCARQPSIRCGGGSVAVGKRYTSRGGRGPTSLTYGGELEPTGMPSRTEDLHWIGLSTKSLHCLQSAFLHSSTASPGAGAAPPRTPRAVSVHRKSSDATADDGLSPNGLCPRSRTSRLRRRCSSHCQRPYR